MTKPWEEYRDEKIKACGNVWATPYLQGFNEAMSYALKKFQPVLDAASFWVENTDDSCGCGYYEEMVSKDNPEGWGTCGLCATKSALAEFKKEMN